MTRTDHYLSILAEECAEVAQRASKALRFGLSEIQEGQTLNNAQRIMVEMADLIAATELLMESGAIEEPTNFNDMVEAKKLKVARFLEFSRSQGTLNGE